MTLTYRTGPIRTRRSAAAIADICRGLYGLLEEDHPLTVRQLFYRAVTAGLIEKTEAEYKQTVCRLLAKMRKEREVPYSWITDNTRLMRKSPSYSSMEEALEETVTCYRRALWDTQPAYVEVWTEKDALTGVLVEETDSWDVPLMPVRGFSSLTFLASAAETIAAQRKPAYLYYLGDLDPSGVDIARNVEQTIRDLAPGAEVHFERIAVTREQVRDYELPTRPTKKTDTRSKNFEGDSVEVDALPPRVLRGLVRERIIQHINPHAWLALQATEREERAALAGIMARLQGGER